MSFVDGWIQTVDLWYGKQPLYQLQINHCLMLHKVVTLIYH